jgi:hypothetical protein
MTEADWLACTDPQKMLRFLRGKASDRKLRLFAVACCRRVQHFMVDDLSRRAVQVAEEFTDGQATIQELQTARDAASDATHLPYDHDPDSRPPVGSWYAARAACGSDAKRAWDNALFTAWAAGATAATNATRWDDPAWERVLFDAWARHNQEYTDRWGDLFWEAPFELGWDAFITYPAWVTERREQADLLRDLCGNPFRPVSLDPAILKWKDSTIVRLAQGIYAERAFDRLPILADALEEAGCTNADILAHCRRPGAHVRGCWAVDLLLGKE